MALGAQRTAHHRVRTPHERERRPEQQASGAGERAQVEGVELGDRTAADPPVRLGRLRRLCDRSRVERQRHEDGDGDGGDEQPAAHIGHPPGAGTPEQQHHDDRPDQVELLLDRQAPEVAQRGEVARRRVAEPLPDLVPVRHVERAGEHVAAQLAERVAFEDRRPQRDHQHHQEHGGQESAGAAQPELSERDAVRAFAFGDEQQGDQVAGDDEEHLDAEEAAREPGAVGVIDHHRDDGDGSQPVQPGQVRQATDLRGVARSDGGSPRRGDGRHRPSSITDARLQNVSRLRQDAWPHLTLGRRRSSFATRFRRPGPQISCRKRGVTGTRVRPGHMGICRNSLMTLA